MAARFSDNESLASSIHSDSHEPGIQDSEDFPGHDNWVYIESNISESTQRLLDAWRKLSGDYKQEEVTKALGKDINIIAANELTDKSFREAFESRCPLVALAKPLLNALKRYERWDTLMEEIYDEEYFSMPWSSKILLHPFITYLPLLQSRDLVERISEMNIPVPIVFRIPQEMATAAHISGSQPLYCIPFSSLRNVILPGKPFVLSCGTEQSKGKSTFLNIAFETKFEVNAEDDFHPCSADVVLDRPMMPLPYNIIDCHGNISKDILRFLSGICKVALLHVTLEDVEESRQGEVIQFMEALQHVETIIILVRDVDKNSRKLLQQFNERVDSWSKDKLTVAVQVLDIPRIKSGEQFHRKFRHTLKDKFIPFMDYVEQGRVVGFYEELEAFLYETYKDNENFKSNIDFRRSGEVSDLADLKFILAKVEKSLEDDKFVDSVFPLSKIYIEMEKRKQMLLVPVENESEKDREKRESKIQKKINILLGKMANAQENNPYRCIMDYFREHVLKPQDITAMYEFSYIIGEFSKYNISLGDSMPPIRRLRGGSLPLAMDNFWREALLMTKKVDDSHSARDSLSILGRSLLLHGYPLEVLNGDSLSMDTDFLKDVLQCADKGNLVVCSVIGPQSSHKSTLLNYLFGCGFAVGAGRCTKGLYASLFKTEYKGADNLLVLDTEGLLSIEKRDHVFDKQMTILALALSHIVLINVKGEMGTEMKNVLEITMLGLKRLRVQFPQPRIFFILRDMVDLNIAKQTQAIQSILRDIHDVAKKMDFQITVDKDSFILLPTALSPIPQKGLFPGNNNNTNGAYERNVIFGRCINDLKHRILQDAVMELAKRSSADNPFMNVQQWVSHAKRVWDSVQLFGDLLNFSTLKDYYDRDDLGRITQEIVKEVLEKGFMPKAINKVHELLSAVVDSQDLAQPFTAATLLEKESEFSSFLDRILPKYETLLIMTFKARVMDLRIPEALKDEYKDTLLKALNKMHYTAQQEFLHKKGRGVVRVEIHKAIDDVRQWIDLKVGTIPENEAKERLFELFEEEWSSTVSKVGTRLRKQQPSKSEIERNLRNDFHSVGRKIPTLTIIRNQIASRTDSPLTDMTTKLNPFSPSFSSEWFDIMQKNYITRPRNFLSLAKVDIQQHCYLVLERISKLFSGVKNRTNGKLWNSSAIQGTIIDLDNTIRDIEERKLQPCGRQFLPLFYSICHSSLYALLRDAIIAQHLQQTEESLKTLESYKENLSEAFVRLVTGRYNDQGTSSSIAAFFTKAISESEKLLIEDEFFVQLWDAAKLSSHLLMEKSEAAQSDEDVFKYITDTVNFMEDIFDYHFNEVYENLIETKYQGKFEGRIEEKIKALNFELNNWISWWSEPRVVEYLKNMWMADGDTTRRIAEAIFSLFVNYLKGEDPQSDTQLKLLDRNLFDLAVRGRPKKRSDIDFSFLFSSIPQTHAIMDPKAFVNELILQLKVEAKKGANVKFIPDETRVLTVRNELWINAIGCLERCPLCLAKCSDNTIGHPKHSSKFHRMTAFAGVSIRDTRDFDFAICTSHENQKAKWAKRTDSFMPFNEFMKEYHPDWVIPIIADAQIHISNKIRWIQVRQRLCDHYKLDDNTPSEWLALAEDNCPYCHRPWGSCGKEGPILCGHKVGAECLSILLGKPSAEKKCPKCSAPLS